MKDEDSPATGNATGNKENVSTSVPPATMPENKPKRTHEHSHAAHLEDEKSAEPHTNPAGDQRDSKYPINRRNP